MAGELIRRGPSRLLGAMGMGICYLVVAHSSLATYTVVVPVVPGWIEYTAVASDCPLGEGQVCSGPG